MIRPERRTNQTRSTDQALPGVSDADQASSNSEVEIHPALSILHVYAGNLYGGIETLLSTLARTSHLEPSMRMEYALCFPGRLREELQTAGADVHDLGPVKFRHPWSIVRARRRLAILLERRRFDIVVTHSCWPHAVFAPTARRLGRRVVFWQHDFVGKGHWLERLASKTRPDLVISNSRASAATLPQLFPASPAEVVYCPVSPPTPPPDPSADRMATRREFGVPEGSTVIIQACRMERWKGHTLFLESLGRLSDRQDWVAWIVGGAQRPHELAYLEELKSVAAEAGISNRVRFLGQRADVPRLLAAADIHCQPNIDPEPFGIAFIEAMNAGLPVVSTRIGGATEIVTPECGVLVDPGDVAALTGVLRGLIDDPSRRTWLGRDGPSRAAELCDPGRVLNRLIGLLGGLKPPDTSH